MGKEIIYIFGGFDREIRSRDA